MADVPKAWDRYREIVPGAFSATLSDADESRQQRDVDELLERSDDLRDAIVSHLDGENTEEREMAALQLQAAAAIDLDHANTLAAMDEGGARAVALSDGRSSALDRILSTPTEQGISAVLDLAGGGLSATASEPVSLKDAVGATVDNIVRDAERAAGTTACGLVGFAELDLAKHLNDGVEQVFGNLSDGLRWLKRKALALALRAVEKLLAVFGAKTEPARKQIASWANDLEEGKAITLLQRLYKVSDLKTDFYSRIDECVDAVSSSGDGAAWAALATLEKKWHLRTQVIDTLGKLAGYAKVWILAIAPPLGAVAYATGFATATGYVVLAGGDYLDCWPEDVGLLNLVEGVGTIVDRAVKA